MMFNYNKWLNPELKENEKDAAISANAAINRLENSKNSGNSNKIYPRPTLSEAREILGEDWFLYSNNPKAIGCWMDTIAERRMMEDGIVPSDYTEVTHCKCCGDVYVLPGVGGSGHILGCPWCSNKIKNLPVPNAKKECVYG